MTPWDHIFFRVGRTILETVVVAIARKQAAKQVAEMTARREGSISRRNSGLQAAGRLRRPEVTMPDEPSLARFEAWSHLDLQESSATTVTAVGPFCVTPLEELKLKTWDDQMRLLQAATSAAERTKVSGVLSALRSEGAAPSHILPIAKARPPQ